MQQDVYLSWFKEFHDLDLGDQRLTKRFLSVLNDFSNHPPASIFEASHGDKDRAKAAYRLMDQDKLEVNSVWSHHQQNTLAKMKEQKVVLIVSDTTMFNFDSHLNTEGLGRIGKKMGGSSESQGLIAHNVLAVTPGRLPLGILDQRIFARGPKKKGAQKKWTTQVPYLEKESSKWSLGLIKGLQGSETLLSTRLIAVSDRESDINAYLGTALELGVDVIVRGKFERKEHGTLNYLDEFMKRQPVGGSFKLGIIKRHRKTGFRRNPTERLKRAVHRTAKIAVRWAEVEIRVENLHDEPRFEKFRCVYALETNPPEGDDPIEWLLLTSLPVTSFKKAREVIEYYSTRWIIEVFHKMIKTGGCCVEDCGLQTKERLERYITMESLVALKLTQLTYYSRCHPDVACTKLVDQVTWETAYCMTKKTKTLPEHPPTAYEFTIMVAKLGGYLNRKSDAPPGGIILRRGWERLQDMKSVYEVLRPKRYG